MSIRVVSAPFRALTPLLGPCSLMPLKPLVRSPGCHSLPTAPPPDLGSRTCHAFAVAWVAGYVGLHAPGPGRGAAHCHRQVQPVHLCVNVCVRACEVECRCDMYAAVRVKLYVCVKCVRVCARANCGRRPEYRALPSKGPHAHVLQVQATKRPHFCYVYSRQGELIDPWLSSCCHSLTFR